MLPDNALNGFYNKNINNNGNGNGNGNGNNHTIDKKMETTVTTE